MSHILKEAFYYWSADLLADYIVKVHQRKIRERIVAVEAGIKKLWVVQDQPSPELYEAEMSFLQLVQKMEAHFSKEAVMVLPFARRYARALKKQSRKVGLQSACPSIHKMYHAHKAENLNFKQVFAVMKQVIVPNGNSLVYENICENIEALKTLWEAEIQLENDILFPKIVEMEALLSPS